jgi:DegV family protein with EDD domain
MCPGEEEEMKVAIVTDSTADLPADLAAQRDITIIPLYLIWGDQQLKAGIDITNDEFYERLPHDPRHPSSSQPTPADFLSLYRELDADHTLVVAVSDRLSGTYASATAAQAMYDKPVTVINTRAVSMGLGWQALAAADVRDRGGSVDEMVAAAEAVRASSSILFCPATLEYLHRGGRIGAAAKLLGSALQLKPILMVDLELGIIDTFEKIRTRTKSLARLTEASWQRLDPAKTTRIAVIHGHCEEEARQVADMLRAHAEPAELVLAELGPVVGTHGGPGIIGIAGYSL